MGTRIIVCGLNGTGKSTLGKALSKKLGFHFVDVEDLYFPEAGMDDRYAFSRTREEVNRLLISRFQTYEDIVFSAVKGDYGGVMFDYCIILAAPKEVRLQRVKQRSFASFGGRVLPGGDLYEREKSFWGLVQSRQEYFVENWAATLRCPIIRVNTERSIGENVSFLAAQISC